MTAQPHPSQFEMEPDAEARAARRIAVAHRLVEMGLEVAEALSEREWEYDYLRRPVGAVIARLCEDYDLEPDWSLWAGEAWAIEEAATNAEGSPYAEGGVAWVVRDSGEPPDADTDCEEPAGGSP